MISIDTQNALKGQLMFLRQKIQKLNEELRRIRIDEQATLLQLEALHDKLERLKFICEPQVVLTEVRNRNQGEIILGRVSIPLSYRRALEGVSPRYWSFVVGNIVDLPPIGSEELRNYAEAMAQIIVRRRAEMERIF
jgi:hypothetical protein